jgi:uncharacterized membrane protein YtjA (UPF0391 family)
MRARCVPINDASPALEPTDRSFCSEKSNGTPSAFLQQRKGGVPVLYYALVFLVVGLIAGILGATGVAAIASQIAWILFIVGIILLVVHLATGRRGPVI